MPFCLAVAASFTSAAVIWWLEAMLCRLVILALAVWLSACSDNRSQGPEYVLAFSWHPAFCETAPRKPECRNTADKSRGRFSLHGLWPQPGNRLYCGVNGAEMDKDKRGNWRALDVPRIAEPVWQKLRDVMPGTRSSLHKHEWVKHGTCYRNSDIDAYYADSIKLMEWISASSLTYLFDANLGRQVTGKDIRDAFEHDFGRGSGDRLRISCKRDPDSGRQLIVELTLGLAGNIAEASSLAPLVEASPKTDPGCPAGIVDPPGFQ